MGGGSSTQTDGWKQEHTSPWSVQTPYLVNSFNDAQNQYNKNMAQGPYSGDYIAPTNQNQYTAANNQYNTAMGSSNNANQSIYNVGSSLMRPGIGSMGSAASGLYNFDNGDQTGNNINNAQRYSQGFNVPGQVQAAMQGGLQTAANSTLPSLYRSAARGGNLNSDRTAISDGLVRQGLAQQAAGLTSQLGNSVYQTGLGTSENDNAQRLQGLSQLGSLGSNATQMGTGAMSTGINNQATINNQANTGAQRVQSLDQSNLNNDISKYNNKQDFGWQQLDNMFNIVGGRSWGQDSWGTSSENKKTNPGLMETLGSGLGALGSLGKLASPKGGL